MWQRKKCLETLQMINQEISSVNKGRRSFEAGTIDWGIINIDSKHNWYERIEIKENVFFSVLIAHGLSACVFVSGSLMKFFFFASSTWISKFSNLPHDNVLLTCTRTRSKDLCIRTDLGKWHLHMACSTDNYVPSSLPSSPVPTGCHSLRVAEANAFLPIYLMVAQKRENE